MAIIIEAPNEVYSVKNNLNTKIFLAGGITGCENWQNYVISELTDVENITIYNPRRKNFPIGDPAAAEAQITWEFNHLLDADIIVYWFAKGSDNPIVLYELGLHGNSNTRPIIIGVDPEYSRKQDVIIQTSLARPDIEIHKSMEDFIDAILQILVET